MVLVTRLKHIKKFHVLAIVTGFNSCPHMKIYQTYSTSSVNNDVCRSEVVMVDVSGMNIFDTLCELTATKRQHNQP